MLNSAFWTWLVASISLEIIEFILFEGLFSYGLCFHYTSNLGKVFGEEIRHIGIELSKNSSNIFSCIDTNCLYTNSPFGAEHLQ